MTLNSRLYGLRADTAIHAGTGESDGKIDLPIMREQHTGYPVVFGSSVKGALRAAAEQALGRTSDELYALFGPDTNNASDHAGCLLVGDARLLALPVRSLTSQYRLVTCPGLIQRLARDADRLGIKVTFDIPEIKNGSKDRILTTTDEKHSHLFLEDFAYECSNTDLSGLVNFMAQLADLPANSIQEKLAVVSNDAFAHICQSAIPVQAHIAINNDTKTVEQGALWYEESLPSDTLMYLAVSAWASRRPGYEKSGSDCLGILDEQVFGARPYLQLGGNETTGMGWCKLTACNNKEV
tara:strand:- start:1925 stop:2812 length:888 start_codon:yes stop_codon:yes gene_type:complete